MSSQALSGRGTRDEARAVGARGTRLEPTRTRLRPQYSPVTRRDKGTTRCAQARHTDAQRAPGLFHLQHYLLLCPVSAGVLFCSVPFCPVLSWPSSWPYPVPAQRSRETTPTLGCDLGSDRAEPYLDLSAGTCPIRSFRSGITLPATVLLAYRTTFSIPACTTHTHTHTHTRELANARRQPSHPFFFLSFDEPRWCRHWPWPSGVRWEPRSSLLELSSA